ncbi:Maf family protein [Ruminiclostridium cellobioparum]|uniref:dTTP/UTP pyrophosphatase n=1 Tax=Ruminiclostridium cellobioparum subsp. termitidis CT1112 TaxID=1195236 RepID=S0FQQ1_RUMCE|nr:Maf family protein [Ruminiclostridium cellobioparum]EMS74167.1 MAF protein [Ruminiclostridium cellobioparum subsp. termitidis CT1112]
MDKIILASASPRRQQLLTQMGLGFTVSPSNVIEVMDRNLESHQVAVSLARQKCVNIATQTKHDSLVIGADTIVVKDNKLLGKPKDEQEAFEMLKNLNGEWHEVVTGVCLCRTSDMKTLCEFETTRVKIAKKSEEFLLAYIATKEPFDKAGAYGIQGYGSLLVEKIEGDYFNVMGLPIYRLSCMFEQLGHGINLKNLSI